MKTNMFTKPLPSLLITSQIPVAVDGRKTFLRGSDFSLACALSGCIFADG
jgi:hypothetical protein